MAQGTREDRRVIANMPANFAEGDTLRFHIYDHVGRRPAGFCPHTELVGLVSELAGISAEDMNCFCGWSTNEVSDMGPLAGREGTEYRPVRLCYIALAVLGQKLQAVAVGSDTDKQRRSEILGSLTISEIRAATGIYRETQTDNADGKKKQIVRWSAELTGRESDEKVISAVYLVYRSLARVASDCIEQPGEEFFGCRS